MKVSSPLLHISAVCPVSPPTHTHTRTYTHTRAENSGGGKRNGTDRLPQVFDHVGSNIRKDFIILL